MQFPFRLAACALAMSVAATAPSFAATTVHVTLWDKGPASLDGVGEGKMMGMAQDPSADMSMAMVGVKADVATVPAGEVTFEVTNSSKDIVHEMILAPVADLSRPLPFDPTTQRVDEDTAGHLGEVSELDPGKGGKLTVTLKPGEYILFCNLPGHFQMGMWTTVKVTG